MMRLPSNASWRAVEGDAGSTPRDDAHRELGSRTTHLDISRTISLFRRLGASSSRRMYRSDWL